MNESKFKLYGIDRENLEQHLQTYVQANYAKQIHSAHRTLEEVAFYPAHDPRRETKEYKAVHDKLCNEKDLPCLVCGVRKSTLSNDKLNPYGAKQMETHHHVVEWALANAVDAGKFNSILRPFLKKRHQDKPEYDSDFTQQQIVDWVDHSEDNLWVLCDVHHRHKYLGIHAITYPIWAPTDILRDDFEAYAREQLLKTQ